MSVAEKAVVMVEKKGAKTAVKTAERRVAMRVAMRVETLAVG